MILNVWFAIKQPITKYKRSFPYKALNPLTNKKVVIENKEQAYGVLMDCYDDAKEKGYEIGEALYSQLFFFADPELFFSSHCQNIIIKYTFCDTFKCPPYPSLSETPADLVDQFLIIKSTINKATSKKE